MLGSYRPNGWPCRADIEADSGMGGGGGGLIYVLVSHLVFSIDFWSISQHSYISRDEG
jgi:hypothetical protein